MAKFVRLRLNQRRVDCIIARTVEFCNLRSFQNCEMRGGEGEQTTGRVSGIRWLSWSMPATKPLSASEAVGGGWAADMGAGVA